MHAMTRRLLFFVISLASVHQMIEATTLVYNLKIRRSFSLHHFLKREHDVLWLLSAVPVIYARKRHLVVPQTAYNVHEKTLIGGSIFNVRALAPHDWWAELTTGIERQQDKVKGTRQGLPQNYTIARTGLDDIVITAGKNWRWYRDEFFDKAQIVAYGLAGFPTRWKVCPNEVADTLVGTRFLSAGFGAEGSYTFFANKRRSLSAVLQTRFVHFFNRKWYPLLPCSARIEPGNITDLFFIMQYREKMNLFETGYNATIFSQQAVKLATGKEQTPLFVRNSFYCSYTRVFKNFLGKHPGTLGIGCNISRDTLFETKITGAWINLSLLI
jgi:hypothetical protein